MLVDLLIFIAVAALVMGGLLGGALWLTRAKPRQTNMVLLGTAGSEAGARICADRLSMAGIWSATRKLGDMLVADLTTPGVAGPYGYAYEVWARPKDEARARAVLGL